MAGSGIATFMGRLRRDVRGNTLAIMAAAMIPLIAMIGSGVDMTRAYMAQNRFRQACDAGALAGRRLLAGTTVSQAVRDEVNKYYRFNFPLGQFQSASYTPNISIPSVGTLHVDSETTIPTTIMKMFGFNTLPITASCSATQDFVGTDIMLVVDMSGSMNCTPSASANCNNNEVEANGSKMAALRTAATSLYDTLKDAQDQLHDNNLRLRYGFVPYNATVNVGRLVYAKNKDYIRSGAYVYNTRTANMVDDTGYGSKSSCDAVGGTYSAIFGNFYGRCNYSKMSDWAYGKYPQDISAYVTGAAVRTPTSTNVNDKSTWAGCIEERKTNNVDINGGTSTTAPADAWDLDINRIPNSDDSRWAPWWPEVTLDTNGDLYTAPKYCASEASRLKEYYNNRAGFINYLKSLSPAGSTYHDIGMIWGARFISPDGIFRSATPETNDPNDPDNPKKLRGFNVRKYIIFMTDGEMAPTMDGYSTYGVELLDKRVIGAANSNTQKNRHLQRFRMACNAAKSQNVEVWVIAFSTSLTDDMKKCASDDTKAAGISTTADLIAKFEEIGSKIGSLRLSQ